LAESFLKGAAFDTLVHRTEDGIIKGPLSTRADISTDIAPYFRKDIPLLDQRDWHISAPVSDPDISFANRQLLEDLNGGASAARITCGVDGVAIRHKNDLKRLLDQVFTDLIPIYLAPHEDGFVFKLFENYEKSHLNLGLSPRTADLETYTRECPENWKLVTLDAAQIYDRGGTDIQELAYLAASAAYTFRQLGPEPASRHISAELATHQDGHVSIAKLRAARRIYARIAQSFGIENQSLSLHAITAKRMMQKIDPWTNMLRVMSAGFRFYHNTALYKGFGSRHAFWLSYRPEYAIIDDGRKPSGAGQRRGIWQLSSRTADRRLSAKGMGRIPADRR